MSESSLEHPRFRLSDARPPETSSMSVAVALDALDLAALLCSRVCHDLISPAGAIVNGLEVLEEKDSDEETKTFALDLIKRSARTASARLQFCRLAFGAAGSASAQTGLGNARVMARGFIEDDKTKLTWNLPHVLLPKNRVKLLLNMLIIAGQTIPRGGVLTVDPIGGGETMGFRISASGLNARIPHAVPALLEGTSENGSIDAHAVQPYYAGLLARACGLRVSLTAEGDAIVVAPVGAPAGSIPPHQLVLEPGPHGGAAERQVVALAVLGAALVTGEDPPRLLLRAAGVVKRLCIRQRNLLVVRAVHDQEWAPHFLHDAVELERLESFQRLLEGWGAHDPHDVVAGHGERCLELRLHAPLPDGVIVPDRAPGDAGSKSRFKRGTARGIVAAKTDRDDADLLRIDVRAPLQEIDTGAARLLV